MARAEQIQRGIQRYVNEEFLAGMSGWQQFAAATALGAALPLIKNETDIEPLYRSAKEQIQQHPAGVTMTKADMVALHPLLGTVAGVMIDSVTFREADIDKLYRYIMEG